MKLKQLFVGFIAFTLLISMMSAVLADVEPNDDIANAETVYDGDVVSGDLDDVSDASDYYRIYLDADDVLLVTMTTGDFDIDLYGPAETWLTSDTWDDNYDPHIRYTVSETGYFYIQVSTWYYSGNYTIEIYINPATFPDAVTVYDGDAIEGNLEYGTNNDDVYGIYLDSGDTLYVLEVVGSFDFNLYDDTGSFIDDYWFYDSYYYLDYTAAAAGYYYIEIQTWYSSGDYTLKFGVNNMPSTSAPISGDPWVGGAPYVDGNPKADVPAWDVGDGWWFGNIVDLSDAKYQDQIAEGMAELESMGMDASVDVSGGVGVYFGVEVVSDSTDYNGYNCYDVSVDGAVGIDLGIDLSVSGSMNEGGYSMDMDIKGNGFLTAEGVLNGNMYFTTDTLALAGISLTLTAEAAGQLTVDGYVNALGQNIDVNMDASLEMTGVEVEFIMDFEPPLDIFQFPIWEGKEWYVPAWDTDVSGELNAQGTVSYSATGNVMGEPINEGDTVDLATEIGDNNYYRMIPGGQPDSDYWGYSVNGGTLLECTYANGNVFVIESSLGDVMGFVDTGNLGFPGTRQLGMDTGSFMPDMKAGLQFDTSEGFVTGATMDGEVITEPTTKEEVASFSEDPQGEVTKETGGASSGGGFMNILLLVIIVAVVVVVLVVVMKKKGGKPEHEYGQDDPYAQQQHQQYDPQYQQPPPQYPQDPYQQPPPPPPQQDQF